MGYFSLKSVFCPDSHIFQSILTKFGDWIEGEVMEGARWQRVVEGGRWWWRVAKRRVTRVLWLFF